MVTVLPFGGSDAATVLGLAAAAEAHRQHPLAQAVLRHARERGVPVVPASDVQALTGRGVRGSVGGETVFVGNERLFEELGAADAASREALAAQAAGGSTAVLVGTASAGAGSPVQVRGLVAIADRVRPRAAGALRDLHRAGIRRVVMLTGDNEGATRAVATALGGRGEGLDDFRAGLLPDDKRSAVEALRREHGPVLFVATGSTTRRHSPPRAWESRWARAGATWRS